MSYTEEDSEVMYRCYLRGVEIAKQTVADWDLSDPVQLKDALDFLRDEIDYLVRTGRIL
jgi:hypothetical protein